MSNTKRQNYVCNSCGETGLFAKAPSYCPYCGSSEINRNSDKAKRHAEEVIEQMNDLLPKLENAWDEYVAIYCEFENKRRVLEDYVRRGIIRKSDVPKFERKKLIDALTEYRARRKENE